MAALLGLGLALAYWGRDLAGDEVVSGPYPIPNDDPEAQTALADRLQEDARVLTRRSFLTQAARLRRRGLRPQPGRPRLRPGAATEEGPALDRLGAGRAAGHLRRPAGDARRARRTAASSSPSPRAQADAGRLPGRAPALRRRRLHAAAPGARAGAPRGSSPTRASAPTPGAPSPSTQDEAEVLACPCHQSTFDVRDGGRPVSGPAGRALPQLPLAIDAEGHLVAQSDFTEPVGPGAWNAT